MAAGNDEQTNVLNTDVGQRVDAITERGLELYGEGKLAAALKQWE